MGKSRDQFWGQIERVCVDHVVAVSGLKKLPPKLTALPHGLKEFLKDNHPNLKELSDDDDESGSRFPLGSYKQRSSPGIVTLYLDNLGVFFWHMLDKLLLVGPLTAKQIRQLAAATVYVTYLHERFHHYSDMVRESTKAPYDQGNEESCAVALSWFALHGARKEFRPVSPELWKEFVRFRFAYRLPRYLGWSNLGHCHVFAHKLDQYLGTSARHLKDCADFQVCVDAMLESSDWNSGQIAFHFNSNQLASRRSREGLPRKPTSIGGSPVRAGRAYEHDPEMPFGIGKPYDDKIGKKLKTVSELPTKAAGNLWCCNNRFESLKDIHKCVVQIDGDLCLYNNPIRSHVLGLFAIKGIGRAVLWHRDVEKLTSVAAILDKYLHQGKAGMVDAKVEFLGDLEDYLKV